MTPTDDPELSEHYRREFKRAIRARIESTRFSAVADKEPGRRESKRRHEAAMAASLVTFQRVWKRMSEGGVREGNR